MYFSSAAHGQETSAAPSPSGMPTECRQGTKSPSPSASSAGCPILVMIRIETTT
jgi:hypothetical protein